jgi:hypothetical protein
MSLSNVAASVRQRLLNRARDEGEDVQRLLVRYALERMPYRITASDRDDRFVLKGAFTFLLWQGALHRLTRDLDLMGYGSPEPRVVEDVFRAICMTDAPDDGLHFDPSSVTAAPIRDQAEYDGLRVKLVAHLGSARIPLQVDIGFGDAITPDPEFAEFPALLEFPAPRVRMYPRETVIAEKLHGTVRFGMANTRMKDYYDLWFLSEHFSFEGAALQRAIRATFRRRGTALPDRQPIALTDEFARSGEKRQQWTAFLDRVERARVGPALPEVVHRVQAFLLPVLRALREEEPFRQTWPPSGPWDDA